MLSLPQYIESVGDAVAADLFRVKLRTVESWRRRERFPRAEQARLIVRVTDGQVDYRGIFEVPQQDQAA
jgi:hypothetical protein